MKKHLTKYKSEKRAATKPGTSKATDEHHAFIKNLFM
jgi:hypothetical protein